MSYAETKGFVYFIAPKGGGPIKIGFSGTPKHRLIGLMSWSPVELELLATAPGLVCDERATQNLFIEHHFRHEWFKPNAALYALIDRVKATGELPPECRGDVQTRVLVLMGRPRTPWSDQARANAREGHRNRVEMVRESKAIIANLRSAVPNMSNQEIALACGDPNLAATLASRAPWLTRADRIRVNWFVRKITRRQKARAA